MTAGGGPPMEQLTPQEIRADRVAHADVMALLGGPLQEVARVEDRTIPGPAQPIPIRVYRPAAGNNLPAVVYYHGGGWVFGNLDSVDRSCRALANASGCVIISVDYVVCLMARDRGGPKVAFQLLVYPVTDYADDRPSSHEFAQGYFLTRPMMDYFWGHYLIGPEDGRHPHASPIQAESLAGLPPAMVITAECDPIRDQGEAYAQRLRDCGVSVLVKRYEGAIHAFFNLAGVIDAGKQAIADSAATLKTALAA
jgi:acetyl esterase